MKFQFLLLGILCCQVSFAQNPIIGDIGISDPHIRVFNDTIFLFSGHDADREDRIWTMKDWRVFSTSDLMNWSLRDTISPKDNYMDNNTSDCWAGDASSRNGKYYFYFSDQKRGVGVMVSDSPSGPYIDPLGKPLVSPMHDPTLFVDDNVSKTPYLVYGDKAGGGFHVAKLNEDMISLAESSKPILINGKEWKDAPHWMDKNYLFKYKGTYYLSWGRDYAISKNIYGPYECVGKVGEGHKLDQFAHGSFFWWKGQFYHIWTYYIKQEYKYRECIITYCHFDDKGHIVSDTRFLDKHLHNGVGNYKGSWDKIEAEWYYEISGEIHKQGNKDEGFILSDIKDGNWIRFANVSLNQAYHKFVASTSFKGRKGYLEIRVDGASGKLIGKIDLSSLKEDYSLQEISCKLKGFMGKRDVFLVFKGSKRSRLQLDWFKFEKEYNALQTHN